MYFRNLWAKWTRVKPLEELVAHRNRLVKWVLGLVALWLLTSLFVRLWAPSRFQIAEISITSANAHMVEKIYQKVQNAGERSDIQAIWLRFDTTYASGFWSQGFQKNNKVNDLAHLVQKIGKHKPVVGLNEGGLLMGDYFWVYASCAHRISLESSLLSGALVPYVSMYFGPLMRKLGLKVQVYESDEEKFRGPPLKPLEPGARKEMELFYQNAYRQRLVRLKEDLPEIAPAVLNASVLYSAKDAMSLGVVQSFGSDRAALNWLDREGAIGSQWVRHMDFTPREDAFSWLLGASWAAMKLGAMLQGEIGFLADMRTIRGDAYFGMLGGRKDA